MRDRHYEQCEDQPEGFPCICDHMEDEVQYLYEQSREAEVTG